MLDELEEWNLIMAHYFGLLSLTYQEGAEHNESYAKFLQNMKLHK